MKNRAGKFSKTVNRIFGEEGTSLVTVVFVMLVLGSVGVGLSTSLSTNAAVSPVQYQADRAFFIADGAMQYVLQQYFTNDDDFSDNVSPTPAPFANTPIDFAGGQFWVEYSSQSATSTTITVTARMQDSVRIIRQVVTKAGASGAYAYAMRAEGNITMEGGTGVVDGDLSASGNISNPDGWTVTGTLNPNQAITTPNVNMSNYAAMTDTVHSGSLTISGNYSTNIHATGTISIADGATINGNIYTDGSISIGNNVTVNGFLAAAGNIEAEGKAGISLNGAVTGPDGKALAVLAANGNIALNAAENGSITITGYIHAQGNLSLSTQESASIALQGLMLSQGNLEGLVLSNLGIISITYDETLAIAASSGGSGGVILSKWEEL